METCTLNSILFCQKNVQLATYINGKHSQCVSRPHTPLPRVPLLSVFFSHFLTLCLPSLTPVYCFLLFPPLVLPLTPLKSLCACHPFPLSTYSLTLVEDLLTVLCGRRLLLELCAQLFLRTMRARCGSALK